nr:MULTISPECIES: EAL domain-containing protein [unclassified Idiomarina]
MEAITQHQFVLHYQPILAAQSQTVSSYEALIRWQHPRRGLLYPGDFIPLAEQTGQIVAIGQWVLEQAAKDIAAFNQQSAGQQAVTVAVNISPLQFRRQGFYEELKRVLRVSGLAPELLELEVTESVLMMGADRTRGILNEICELGVQVSIDDFGTGYSSFSYLRDLPVHTLKIDRSFISDIPANQRDSALLQGMIQMAHQLSLNVVVEGIETLEQYEFMRQHGADYLQGFYFARPAPLTW